MKLTIKNTLLPYEPLLSIFYCFFAFFLLGFSSVSKRILRNNIASVSGHNVYSSPNFAASDFHRACNVFIHIRWSRLTHSLSNSCALNCGTIGWSKIPQMRSVSSVVNSTASSRSVASGCLANIHGLVVSKKLLAVCSTSITWSTAR